MRRGRDLLKKFYREKFIPFLKDTTFRRIVAAVLFFFVITGILAYNFVPERYNFQVGAAAPKTIKAPRTAEFIDRVKTEEARQRAAAKVNKVMEEDPSVAGAVQEKVGKVFAAIRQVKGEKLEEAAKVRKLKEGIALPVSDDLLLFLLQADEVSLQKVEEAAKQIVREVYSSSISEESLPQVKERIKKEKVEPLPYHPRFKEFLQIMMDELLQPNLKYNREETERKKREAMNSVAPVRVTVQKGEKIVGEGEIITEEILMKMENLGLLRPYYMYRALIGLSLLVALSMVLILVYLYHYRRSIYEEDRYLLLLGIIFTAVLLIAKLVVSINIGGSTTSQTLMGYLAPVAAASLLIAILLDRNLALLVTAILAVMVGIITGNQLGPAFTALVSGTVAVFSVSHLSQRTDLARAGLFYISGATIVAILGMELATRSTLAGVSWVDVLLLPLVGLGNGIFSAVVAGGTLPYLETAFGITSAMRLLELANPNHPLLKRLLMEAPGTYHHSVMVGNLAEAAAEAVGADSVLVRVGAYFHDIGKLKRPYFFIENQFGIDNPHDKIAPSLSALIITSHVRDGVEMAREAGLPREVVDIIEQHHGTSLVSFFYHRAAEADKNEVVPEESFRYEGPKPQTKEAALVMLADTVEAATRSLQKPTPGRLEGIVRRLIKEKLNEGQLEECNLTFRDLDLIAGAFSRVLSGFFHHRIEYPESVIKELERRKSRDAGIRKQ